MNRGAQSRGGGLGRWRGTAALILALALVSGCRSVEVIPGAGAATAGRMVFMPMDESAAWRGVADYLFVGSTGARGGSAVLTRALGGAFAGRGAEVIPDEEVRRFLWEAKITPEAAARGENDAARRAAEGLRAEVVVTGRITVCRRSWVLFFPWARVEFSLRAADRQGRTLWEATASKTRVWQDERAVLSDLAGQIAAAAPR